MKNLSTVQVPKDDWTSLNRELNNIRDLLKLIPQDIVNYTTPTSSTTTPALKDKYVLPSEFILTTTPTKIMYLTIPQTGLYLIDGFFNALGVGGSGTYMQFYLAKNGVVIPGLKQEPYTAAVGSQFPISFAITEDFNVGDEIAIYGYTTSASYPGRVKVDATREAFLQYTQLSKFVPTVTTVTKEYGFITMSAQQNAPFVGEVTPLAFNTLSPKSNITFNPVNYRVTLKANVRYKMKAQTYFEYSAAGYVYFTFWNVTANSRLNSIYGFNCNGTAYGNAPIMAADFTPSVDTEVDIRISLGALNITDIHYYSSWWEIESIEANVPVVATLGQDAWVGPWQDLILSSWSGTLASASSFTRKVKFRKDSLGQWSALIQIMDGYASGSRSGVTWNVSGFTFLNLPTSYHILTGYFINGAAHSTQYCIAYPENVHSGGLISLQLSASTASTIDAAVNGEVLLNSKPVGYNIPGGV